MVLSNDAYVTISCSSLCDLLGCIIAIVFCRYFLRKLQKVKKAHGQLLAINEVFSNSNGALMVLIA
jgi:hypothetical protein